MFTLTAVDALSHSAVLHTSATHGAFK
jgi:hypothetical protein